MSLSLSEAEKLLQWQKLMRMADVHFKLAEICQRKDKVESYQYFSAKSSSYYEQARWIRDNWRIL